MDDPHKTKNNSSGKTTKHSVVKEASCEDVNGPMKTIRKVGCHCHCYGHDHSNGDGSVDGKVPSTKETIQCFVNLF